jgi:4-hydroxy-tetrahydrodipicolinate reductase
MTNIAVNGALGRMGSRIVQLASQSRDFKVVGAFDQEGSKLSLKNLKGCKVLIDFSSPEGTALSLKFALNAGTGLVIGTTGIDEKLKNTMKDASKKIPILQSPNMSLGANFLFEIASLAARRLKEGYDIEIWEAHHRLKKDAPSGTAKKIAEVIAKEKGWDLNKVAKFGREGFTRRGYCR